MLHEHGETYLEGVFGDSRRFERGGEGPRVRRPPHRRRDAPGRHPPRGVRPPQCLPRRGRSSRTARLGEVAHQKLREDFASGELDPRRRP